MRKESKTSKLTYLVQHNSWVLPNGCTMSDYEKRWLEDEAVRFPYWVKTVLKKLTEVESKTFKDSGDE